MYQETCLGDIRYQIVGSMAVLVLIGHSVSLPLAGKNSAVKYLAALSHRLHEAAAAHVILYEDVHSIMSRSKQRSAHVKTLSSLFFAFSSLFYNSLPSFTLALYL